MNNILSGYISTAREIANFILGRKYYANIVNTRGTSIVEISSFIFRTKEDAIRHKEGLESNNLSYRVVLTVSFRSRSKVLQP